MILCRASADLGFGDFGNVQASGNLNLPRADSFLQTAIIGVGVLTLFNLISTIAVPLIFPNKEPEATPAAEKDGKTKGSKDKATARNMKAIEEVSSKVFNGIKSFVDKYN